MTDATAKVPNEIHWACMDYLSLLDIVHLMGLSKRWHQLATNHETYWKYLTITSSSDSATQWFLLRLSRSRLRLISVDACLLDAEAMNLRIILQGISAHLAYIQSLTCWVTYGKGHTALLFNALSYPAYNLEQLILRIAVNIDALYVPPLPPTLLMRTAPRLTKLTLENIGVDDMPVGIFPSVRQLEFGYQTMYEFSDVQVLLQALVHVRGLTLTGYPRVKDPATIDPSIFRNLDLLFLNLRYAIPDNIRELLPLRDLPHVVCARANNSDVSALMNGVSGNLEMHIQPEEDTNDAFFIHLVQQSNARIRSFTECREYYDGKNTEPCDIFLRADIAERIVFLSLPMTHWQTIMPFVLPLPALTELRIVLSRDEITLLTSSSLATLHCPKLQSLTMRSAPYPPLLVVKDDELASFMSRALSCKSSPIDVVLEGIALSGAAGLPASRVRLMEQRQPSTRIYLVDQTGLLV